MNKRTTVVNGIEILKLIEMKKQPKNLHCYDGCSYLWNEYRQTYVTEGVGVSITAYDLATGVFSYLAPVLDDVEKRYLRGVIRPFRDRVDMIQKNKSSLDGYEFIRMYVRYPNSIALSSVLTLPAFKSGTMYAGMELEKEYTLAELEL